MLYPMLAHYIMFHNFLNVPVHQPPATIGPREGERTNRVERRDGRRAAAAEKPRRADNFVCQTKSFVTPIGSLLNRGEAYPNPQGYARLESRRLPWYKTVGGQWRTADNMPSSSTLFNTRMDDLMPPLDEAEEISRQNPGRGRAWRPWDPEQPHRTWNPEQTVQAVLLHLGNCLYPECCCQQPVRRRGQRQEEEEEGEGIRPSTLTGSDAMDKPFTRQCMFVSPAKLAESSCVRLHKGKGKNTGYSIIILISSRTECPSSAVVVPLEEEGDNVAGDRAARAAKRGKRRDDATRRGDSVKRHCHITAHRFVCWAYNGPPPCTDDHPCHTEWVAMHTCDQKDCLNNHHIVWGLIQENNKHSPPFKKLRRRRR